MKRLVVLLALALGGCSSYAPLVDLRSSGDKAAVYQRDVMECKQLLADNLTMWQKAVLDQDVMLNRCLKGRGHSILTGRV
tara:strand:- start:397 stop:636 length:240 start_codon:yes stop_codon:yes gene_type:complete